MIILIYLLCWIGLQLSKICINFDLGSWDDFRSRLLLHNLRKIDLLVLQVIALILLLHMYNVSILATCVTRFRLSSSGPNLLWWIMHLASAIDLFILLCSYIAYLLIHLVLINQNILSCLWILQVFAYQLLFSIIHC